MKIPFERKQLKEFSDKVKDVFNLMTISREYKIIGSGSLKEIKYSADYDLNEIFSQPFDSRTILDKITKMFQSKFAVAERDPNIFITDFKCGMDSDGEPLRWNKDDIKKGYKMMKNGRKIAFQDCILMKTTMKLDVTALINDRFVEFSDNYLIKLGDDANFFKHDIERDHLLNNLKHSWDENFYARGNYFKALKRAFSYYLALDPDRYLIELNTLKNFFNSPTGLLYKLKNEMETILILLENESGFREPKMSDVKKNIKIILEQLSSFPDLNSVCDHLKKSISSKSKQEVYKHLEESKKELFEIINSATLDFISKNKNIPLY
jgi:hypothetical protein